MRKPYKYQQEVIDKMKDLPYMMIDASCGTGKTLMAIHIAKAKNLPVMVICPKNLRHTWVEELQADDENDVFVYDASMKNDADKKREFMEWMQR